MKKLKICVGGIPAAILTKEDNSFSLQSLNDYSGHAISLTMPIRSKTYNFDKFPPFFEGLLPEGIMLEMFLKKFKLDRTDYFSQLKIVGRDLVGDTTVEAFNE
jgi:serine/threonine-protein kinase HipA